MAAYFLAMVAAYFLAMVAAYFLAMVADCYFSKPWWLIVCFLIVSTPFASMLGQKFSCSTCIYNELLTTLIINICTCIYNEILL